MKRPTAETVAPTEPDMPERGWGLAGNWCPKEQRVMCHPAGREHAPPGEGGCGSAFSSLHAFLGKELEGQD